MRGWFAGLVGAAVVSGTNDVPSAALRIDDGPEFSIDIGALDACVVHPVWLRKADACEGFTPDSVPVPTPTDAMRVVSIAIASLEDESVVVFTVIKANGHSDEPFTSSDAKKAMDDVAAGVREHIKTGDVRTSGARIVPVMRGAKGIRGSIDIANPPAKMATLDHQAILQINTSDGGYAVMLLGSHEAAAEIDRLMDQITPTATVAWPAKGKDVSALVAKVLASFVTFGVAATVVLVSVLLRRRKAPPYMPPAPPG